VPSERTFVTELATALGMCKGGELEEIIEKRPTTLSNLSGSDWEKLALLKSSGRFERDFESGFQNGRGFLAAPDALNGRLPRIIEWTGGRNAPGDEVVPSDLRIDHVYLVSCKYLSRILQNRSPARLVDGLLSQAPTGDSRDWYARVALDAYKSLYEKCIDVVENANLPKRVEQLEPAQRRHLKEALRVGWPPGAEDAYRALCVAVSDATAKAWSSAISSRNAEMVLWRLLRIGSAPYFILGASRSGSMRLRIDTPWDWRESFSLSSLEISPQTGGQPLVGWSASYVVRNTGENRSVSGHVEIRWSHGRFGQPPEAKVYLDSPHEQVPGYHGL
jgi:hypothetical protein